MMNLLHKVTGGKCATLWKVASLAMAVVLVTSLGCGEKPKIERKVTFGKDVAFLDKTLQKQYENACKEEKKDPDKDHKNVVVLEDPSGNAKVLIVPAYQARVMTSTANGDDGDSFGWIHYKHVLSEKKDPHMNAYGGEERFWLGPEGGQFSIFFKPDTDYTKDKKGKYVKDLKSQWHTPYMIDTAPYKIDEVHKTWAKFSYEPKEKDPKLVNSSKTKFDIKVERKVELISPEQAAKSLGTEIGNGVNFVGYRTTNQLTNTGKEAWDKKSGLLSIWLLGMYKPGPETTVVIPFNKGDEAELGKIANKNYFDDGDVPATRLKVDEEKSVLFFTADGKERTKIGLGPKRAKEVAGSYDPTTKTLTIVKYNKPGEEVVDYVNSKWEKEQKEPFAGDAVNSYNDGPDKEGRTMGPFYEIETSSPALALKPNETGTHISETYHFQGDEAKLDPIAQKVLGVSIKRIKDVTKQLQKDREKAEQEKEKK